MWSQYWYPQVQSCEFLLDSMIYLSNCIMSCRIMPPGTIHASFTLTTPVPSGSHIPAAVVSGARFYCHSTMEASLYSAWQHAQWGHQWSSINYPNAELLRHRMLLMVSQTLQLGSQPLYQTSDIAALIVFSLLPLHFEFKSKENLDAFQPTPEFLLQRQRLKIVAHEVASKLDLKIHKSLVSIIQRLKRGWIVGEHLMAVISDIEGDMEVEAGMGQPSKRRPGSHQLKKRPRKHARVL